MWAFVRFFTRCLLDCSRNVTETVDEVIARVLALNRNEEDLEIKPLRNRSFVLVLCFSYALFASLDPLLHLVPDNRRVDVLLVGEFSVGSRTLAVGGGEKDCKCEQANSGLLTTGSDFFFQRRLLVIIRHHRMRLRNPARDWSGRLS